MRRRLIAIGVLLLAGSAVAVPAASAATATAKTKSEAWYDITPVAGPAGAPAVVPPTYGADTLHVGILHGQEESRTYLALDLSAVDSDAQVTGGTLQVPIDPGDGSSSPELARVEACVVAQPPPDAAGATEAPPAYDCATSSPATYFGGDHPYLAFDLSPFGARLRTAGLALLPTDGAKTAGDTWHVAMYGRHNTSAGAQPITASVEFTPAAPLSTSDESAAFTPVAAAPVDATPAPTQSAVAQPSTEVPAAPEIGVPPAAPAAAAPVLGTAAAPASNAITASFSGGFAYSAIWYLPLAIGALGWLLAWALTRSPVPEDA